jgi:hypothetical protein
MAKAERWIRRRTLTATWGGFHLLPPPLFTNFCLPGRLAGGSIPHRAAQHLIANDLDRLDSGWRSRVSAGYPRMGFLVHLATLDQMKLREFAILILFLAAMAFALIGCSPVGLM